MISGCWIVHGIRFVVEGDKRPFSKIKAPCSGALFFWSERLETIRGSSYRIDLKRPLDAKAVVFGKLPIGKKWNQ
jgi:hypothetical protein